MAKNPSNIALYGGSFDPPHMGHLNTAIAVQETFRFKEFFFLPCKLPVLKAATQASPENRVALLQLLLANHPEFKIDTREIDRETPSYMVDTLSSFREECGNGSSITVLMGLDAFLQLPHWHRWHELLKLAHILVMDRPEYTQASVSQELQQWLIQYQTHDVQDLLTTPAGKVYLFNAGKYLISSTDLRQRLQTDQSVIEKLPQSLVDYIKVSGLYR